MTFHHTREVLILELQMQRLVVKRRSHSNNDERPLLSTDTLDKPLEGYAAHRKNTTVHRLINTTFIFDPQHNGRDPKRDRGRYSRKARSAICISIPIDKTRGAKRQTRRQDRPHPKRAKRTIFPQPVIRRRPDIAGPAISLLLGTLRRTQEALAARSAQRGLLACTRTCLKVN